MLSNGMKLRELQPRIEITQAHASRLPYTFRDYNVGELKGLAEAEKHTKN